ncbi:MAG: BLI-3 blue-light-inducible Bli-3 protein [Piccolia ochrophora]|nr:MAG: BLI-3 blue-light-inducible Bli-3 protein [Piccolia ochrophora]
MSGAQFSNTSTGDKAADPYKSVNLDEAGLKEKVEGLLSFVDSSKFGMMTTRQGESGLLVSRCMALAGKENGIDLLFHTNTESGKTDDLTSDSNINVAFLNGSGEWASISGNASIITDREMVRKHYSSALKAWVGDLGDGKHDGGPEDPRIGIILVNMRTATYAVTEQTIIGRSAEVAKGVLTGNAPSVNKLRGLNEEEVKNYRQSHKIVK